MDLARRRLGPRGLPNESKRSSVGGLVSSVLGASFTPLGVIVSRLLTSSATGDFVAGASGRGGWSDGVRILI